MSRIVCHSGPSPPMSMSWTSNGQMQTWWLVRMLPGEYEGGMSYLTSTYTVLSWFMISSALVERLEILFGVERMLHGSIAQKYWILSFVRIVVRQCAVIIWHIEAHSSPCCNSYFSVQKGNLVIKQQAKKLTLITMKEMTTVNELIGDVQTQKHRCLQQRKDCVIIVLALCDLIAMLRLHVQFTAAVSTEV